MSTIYDVAKKAGVSVGTVSNVINNRGNVNPKLRKRVEEAMQRINYVPNKAARSLAFGRSENIAVLYPFNPNSITGTSYLEYVSHLINIANEYGQQLILYPSNNSAAAVVDLEKIATSGQAWSFILFEVENMDHRVSYLTSKGIPFSMVGRTDNSDNLSYVDADVSQIINNTVLHLKENGYERLALLGRKSFVGVDQRIHTEMVKACTRHGLQFDPSLHLSSSWHKEEQQSVIDYFIRRRDDFDAIFITETAARLQFALSILKHNLSIPHDIAVVGYMDSSVDELMQPPITATRIPVGPMARAAIEMLLDLKREEPKQILIPGNLVARQSTAKR